MSNITLLAPSNMAFQTALNSSTGAAFSANNTDVISALFSYHVLNGSYTNFSTMPEFVNTAVQLNLRSAVGALTVAGLADAVDTMMDATFFVPDNAAFQAIGSALATSTPQEIARILQYHVVNGTVGYSSMLTNGSTLTTMDGIPVTITIQDSEIFVNSARVVTQDVLVANGVMH